MEKLVAGNPPCDQKPSCNVPSRPLIQLNNTLSHELESFPSQIPVEIVSEDEMAFIEAALSSVTAATAHRSLLSSPSRIQHRFLNSGGSVLRSCFSSSSLSSSDVEDLGMVGSSSDVQWEEEVGHRSSKKSFLQRFRSRRGLMVTDITNTEWCEKQMEFILLHGKPKQTDAMKAGSSRHAELEKEVVERVAIPIKSSEESWAVKLMNFIIGANQLLFEGLTRELPVLGVVDGVWMVGVIDEIRLSINESDAGPLLIDTKTRCTARLPSKAQERQSRLQLMCYKYLWDSVIIQSFPIMLFCDYFELNPRYLLSDDIQQHIATAGLQAKTFEDVLMQFSNTCCLLPPSQEQLLLRYEFQVDHSLIGEVSFAYDDEWLKSQLHLCLEFWLNKREANYVPNNERWKCRFCTFSDICPVNSYQSGADSVSGHSPSISSGVNL